MDTTIEISLDGRSWICLDLLARVNCEFFNSFILSLPGDVNITIDLMNTISFFHTEKTITIIYQPCPNPLVNIAHIGTQENPMLIKVSEATLLSSTVDYHCPSAINITFLWEVSQNGQLVLRRYQESPLPLKLQLAKVANPSLFNLPPNLLEFGLARVDLTVYFSNWDVDLSTVSTKNTTWLEVEPSNLKSTIQGNWSFLRWQLDDIIATRFLYFQV